MKSIIVKNSLLGLVLGSMVYMPLSAFAVSSTWSATGTASATSTRLAQGDFCVAIQNPDFSGYMKSGKFEDKAKERIEQQEEKRTEREFKIFEKRSEMEKKHLEKKEEIAKKLEKKPLTDEQKTLIAKAQAEMQAAVDSKNGDFSKLLSDYRAQVDKIRDEHRTEVDALIATVKTETDAAIAQAKADCAAGVPSETAKANFQARIKAIHEQFKSDRASVSASTTAELQATAQARKGDAFEIRSTFRDSVKSFWTSFKSWFGRSEN